jgi:hypothetical protein
MALSPDFDPSKRGRFTPEARSSFSSSGVIFVEDSSLLQAMHMGQLSGVKITEEEAALYSALRKRPLQDPESLKSDQALMAEDVLTGERSVQFRAAFPQIFRIH